MVGGQIPRQSVAIERMSYAVTPALGARAATALQRRAHGRQRPRAASPLLGRRSATLGSFDDLKRFRAAAAAGADKEQQAQEEGTSNEYTDVMQQRMGTSLTYRHEDGMFYNRVLSDLIVGSCPQTPKDVDRLAEQENVKAIFCLQQDSDMAYFDLDIRAIIDRCEARGDIEHVRAPIQDFSPHDLRLRLPAVTSLLYRLMERHSPLASLEDPSVFCTEADQGPASGPRHPCVYVHCTAGMGRAPGVALAYMNWVRGFQLDRAFAVLRAVRACCPKLSAVRAATADVLTGSKTVPVTLGFRRMTAGRQVAVAGLDVGWGASLPAPWNPATRRAELVRELPIGDFSFKLVVDGNWTISADHCTVMDGDHCNNLVYVRGAESADEDRLRARLLVEGSDMEPGERARVRAMVMSGELLRRE